jgi:hypothetical protein
MLDTTWRGLIGGYQRSLKMEALNCPETLVITYDTTGRRKTFSPPSRLKMSKKLPCSTVITLSRFFFRLRDAEIEMTVDGFGAR